MVSDNEIDVNERVQTLYNKYPLDIAEICNDKDTYLQLIENGAYNTDNYLSVNYALDNINIKALNIILFTQEEINYSSVFAYSPIKRIGEISIESMFNFLSKLPEKDIVNFFSNLHYSCNLEFRVKNLELSPTASKNYKLRIICRSIILNS